MEAERYFSQLPEEYVGSNLDTQPRLQFISLAMTEKQERVKVETKE